MQKKKAIKKHSVRPIRPLSTGRPLVLIHGGGSTNSSQQSAVSKTCLGYPYFFIAGLFDARGRKPIGLPSLTLAS